MNLPQTRRMTVLSSLFAGSGISLAIAAVISAQTVAVPTPTYLGSVAQVRAAAIGQWTQPQTMEDKENWLRQQYANDPAALKYLEEHSVNKNKQTAARGPAAAKKQKKNKK